MEIDYKLLKDCGIIRWRNSHEENFKTADIDIVLHIYDSYMARLIEGK